MHAELQETGNWNCYRERKEGISYHMPDESGKLNCCLKQDQMNDGQEKLGSVEPEESVSWLQEDCH